MSHYTNMTKAGQGDRRFEWRVNDFGEVVVSKLDHLTGQVMGFCSDSGKSVAKGIFSSAGILEPDMLVRKYKATWEDVVVVLNEPGRRVGKIEAIKAVRVVGQLGIELPIETKIVDGKYRWVVKDKK